MAQIMIVEDNQGTNKAICEYLKTAGHTLFPALDGEEALNIFRDNSIDLAVLDIMLPKMSGVTILHEIRKISNIPVVMLTAVDDEYTQSNSFDELADDYITKPFSMLILGKRITALLRRSENFKQANTEFHSNGITVHLLKGEVYKNGVMLDLTAGEYKLLCLFMENPNIVLSPEQILGRLWDCAENFINNNTLTVYIRRLRAKIEDDPSAPQKIVTVRRMGYKWNTMERGEL